jgi:hypothetical protein
MAKKALTITPSERQALLAVLAGAQDDDDGSDPEYTAALASLLGKTRRVGVQADNKDSA